jgi:hypothetical protein
MMSPPRGKIFIEDIENVFGLPVKEFVFSSRVNWPARTVIGEQLVVVGVRLSRGLDDSLRG